MAKSPKRVQCFMRGPLVGPVKCSCSGATKAHKCFSESVPSGYCTDTMPSNAHDGPIKLPDGTLTEERYMAFAYKQAHLDKGQHPWDTWILCCDECPFHVDPPGEILDLYAKREILNALIAGYEQADTLDDRHRVTQELKGKT